MDKTQGCGLIGFYSFLGKKWSLVLLHTIGEKPLSYNDLNRITKKKISSILLSTRLKEMQNYNLIRSTMVKGKKAYVVTPQGKDLLDRLHTIKDWSITNKIRIPKECREGRCLCSRE